MVIELMYNMTAPIVSGCGCHASPRFQIQIPSPERKHRVAFMQDFTLELAGTIGRNTMVVDDL
jgi:hypothetical protein